MTQKLIYNMTELEIVETAIKSLNDNIKGYEETIDMAIEHLRESFDYHLSSQAEIGFKASAINLNLKHLHNQITQVKRDGVDILNKTIGLLEAKKKECESILITGQQVLNSTNLLNVVAYGWRREATYTIYILMGTLMDTLNYKKENLLKK
jgi:hypothetical protein